MTTLDEAVTKITELTGTIDAIDTKLDEIRAFIATLNLPQGQIDQLNALLDTASTKAQAVLGEADALDEQAT